MPARIPFTKMQGAGNDYVYINGFTERIDDPSALAIAISDRHFGVGSDGLVLILPSQEGDLRMRMFNADGSEAEMCGNASRCVAKYAWEHGLIRKKKFQLETGAGLRGVELHLRGENVESVTVDMGKPILEAMRIPVDLPEEKTPIIGASIEVGGREYRITPVSMGNPHAVVFMENIDALDLPAIGPGFEHHPVFPKRVNTEFVEVIDRKHARMRVWERGAGETLACGTGASAVLVACVLNGLTDREADIEVRGGELRIHWSENDDHVYMTGPAITVFTGEYLYAQG